MRRLRRGETLDATSLGMETRALHHLPRNVVFELDEAIGRRVSRNLQPGSALLHSYFQSAELIRRGDVVRVAANAPGLELRLEAKALEPGRLGQVIRLENPDSRRRFPAEVTGPGTARLLLPGVGAAR